MDKAAQKQIKKKAGAWTRYQESSNYEKYLEYTKIRNKATKQLKNTKREFEKYIAANCKKNPKGFFKYANFKSKAHKSAIRLRNSDGQLAGKDEENARILNNFFTSVFTNEDDAPELILNQSSGFLYGEPPEDPIDMKDAETKTLLSNIEITEELVEALLSKVDPNKSNISECIHPRVLKERGIITVGTASAVFGGIWRYLAVYAVLTVITRLKNVQRHWPTLSQRSLRCHSKQQQYLNGPELT